MSTPHITVCVCTYQRPGLLRRALGSLEAQHTENAFTYSIVVCDNDDRQSAQSVAQAFAAASSHDFIYCAEPARNIALARNRAVAHARGDFIAFIDDDEFATPQWLRHMLATCERTRASGVLGPVRPHFDSPPPRWLVAGGFCERPEYPTGTIMDPSQCRTGNVLFRRAIVDGAPPPFRAEFGTGGEDVDFFRRMTQRGDVFVWCNEGVAYEIVPPSRWTRRYMLTRALLRGRNNFKLRNARFRALLKSAIAVPAYSVVLPGTLLLGQHVFMKYSIKFCDHLGLILAGFGLDPIKERPM